jgi:aryl-alcohol dehydrogenase-like predicted oxidoreductase
MEYRRFGRTGWQVSEIGYGMWGLAGWKDSDDKETERSLHKAVELGCNFFDTAWGYGEGLSEQILGRLIKDYPGRKLYAATKVPPKNRQWPSKAQFALDEVFPEDYIIEYAEKSLRNLNIDCIDLLQFHVWEDSWADREEWKNAVTKLTDQGKVKAWGVSVNRWEPENGMKALETGLFSAVQVIYNIFDQNPEDRLFPLCEKLDIGIIARVPFDEGTLTGQLNYDTVFPPGDWRNTYFVPENLKASVDRANAIKPLIPEGMTMAEMALRFILSNKQVGTIIPGMRKTRNVEANIAASDGAGLSQSLLKELKKHRWERKPTKWSQ